MSDCVTVSIMQRVTKRDINQSKDSLVRSYEKMCITANCGAFVSLFGHIIIP